jgi:vacuolar protein sorting-associated protein 13D
VDVILKLELNHGVVSGTPKSSLACVNFMKSRLMVETYSNNTRDVDLVSQEILITDTRFQGNCSNLFNLLPFHPLTDH